MPRSAKPAGANVEKYMLRTEELRKATEHVGNLAKQEAITRWAESGGKQTLGAKQARDSKAAAEELRQLNHELKTRRRAKLREFYLEQEEVYEKELNDMGLAFVKARV
ncbi:hypothetical protein TL16_g06903 [Triparma laevis f. inornata]|uniref:Uncharacterized protein n=2 Tax=Triparma laevis TaxID=1534972 RepID=A0A9W7L0C6_9STRA|nr:hypothetical protein TL16_g06903 [Triparma laevis f. inornata]GMI17631.1 hypothetical protein TrLO_g4452 [Triparma laevis f. longispina]